MLARKMLFVPCGHVHIAGVSVTMPFDKGNAVACDANPFSYRELGVGGYEFKRELYEDA